MTERELSCEQQRDKAFALLEMLREQLETLPMDALGTHGIPDFIGDSQAVTMMFMRDKLISDINSLLKEAQ